MSFNLIPGFGAYPRLDVALTVSGHATLPTSMISYWRMEEASGSRYDATGFSEASQFTVANSEYLSIADNTSLSTGDIDFTFSGWVYLDSKATHQRWVSKLNTSGDNREYILGYDSSTDRLFLTLYTDGTGGSATQIDANNLGSPSTDTWYFVVGWHDATANTMNIQIDNGTIDSTAYSGGVHDGTAVFNIGAQQSANQWWDGRISNVGFWKRTLTASEKTSLYNAGRGKNYAGLTSGEKVSMESYWNLTESSGTRSDSHGSNDLTDNNTVTGTTGTGNHLTDNNTVTSTTGKRGTAGQFTQANTEYLSHTDNADLSTGDIDFTYALWLQIDPTVDSSITAKYRGTGDQREWYLRYSPGGTNRFKFLVSSDGTSGANVTIDADSFGAASASTWYFLVVWHDSVNNNINIQVDNGAIDTLAHSLGVNDSTAQFNMGAEDGGNTTEGIVDEAGFWKKVLSADEKTFLYNGGSGRSYS